MVDRRWDDLPVASDELRLWVYGIARKVCANHARSQLRFERLRAKIGVLDPRRDTYEEDYSASSIARDLLKAARLKSEEDGELLLLMLEDTSLSDIAGRLEISEAAANSRIHRLRKHLREQLPDFWDDPSDGEAAL